VSATVRINGPWPAVGDPRAPVEKMFQDARTGMIGEENNALYLVGASYL
jgi:hypothetical protein